MAILKGETIVYAVRYEEDVTGDVILRALYQTGGSRTKTRDEIEVSTKDISGSDYGDKTETISFEGLVADADSALEHIEDCIDTAKFAEILEINVKTKKAKVGKYMLSNLAYDYAHGDNATYTVDATLSGDTTEEILTDVPEGATTIE